jgi:alginate O-acetyltransferase complex protein AlgI
MAIGLGRMLGLRFLENFDRPYTARTFTEFWRRWHISLSNWMREYLYIPLGGNRRGAVRTYLNLWIVFLLSGFWHGAAWNFVVWGAYHGLFLCLDKLTGLSRRGKAPAWLGIPVTFLLVTIGWVFFRAADLGHATAYLARMFLLTVPAADAELLKWAKLADLRVVSVLVAAAVFSFGPLLTASPARALPSGFKSNPVVVLARYVTAMLLLLVSASALAAGQFNPFIYFRF